MTAEAQLPLAFSQLPPRTTPWIWGQRAGCRVQEEEREIYVTLNLEESHIWDLSCFLCVCVYLENGQHVASECSSSQDVFAGQWVVDVNVAPQMLQPRGNQELYPFPWCWGWVQSGTSCLPFLLAQRYLAAPASQQQHSSYLRKMISGNK